MQIIMKQKSKSNKNSLFLLGWGAVCGGAAVFKNMKYKEPIDVGVTAGREASFFINWNVYSRSYVTGLIVLLLNKCYGATKKRNRHSSSCYKPRMRPNKFVFASVLVSYPPLYKFWFFRNSAIIELICTPSNHWALKTRTVLNL